MERNQKKRDNAGKYFRDSPASLVIKALTIILNERTKVNQKCNPTPLVTRTTFSLERLLELNLNAPKAHSRRAVVA